MPLDYILSDISEKGSISYSGEQNLSLEHFYRSIFIFKNIPWSEVKNKFESHHIFLSGGLSTKRHILSPTQRRLARICDELDFHDGFTTKAFHSSDQLLTTAIDSTQKRKYSSFNGWNYIKREFSTFEKKNNIKCIDNKNNNFDTPRCLVTERWLDNKNNNMNNQDNNMSNQNNNMNNKEKFKKYKSALNNNYINPLKYKWISSLKFKYFYCTYGI